MNIFIVSPSPLISAQALDDLRLNKMLLETAQLLSNAYRYWFAVDHEMLYKVTHENHPCNIWLREDINNMHWLVRYFAALNDERKMRKDSADHLSFEKIYPIVDKFYTDFNHSEINFTFNCSNVYPSTNNIFVDYKLCLLQKWVNDIRMPTFATRGAPDFLAFDLVAERKHISKLSLFEREVYLRKMLMKNKEWLKHETAQAA